MHGIAEGRSPVRISGLPHLHDENFRDSKFRFQAVGIANIGFRQAHDIDKYIEIL
jgi:hypothetical protein